MSRKETLFAIPSLLISLFFAVLIVPNLKPNLFTFVLSLIPFMIVILAAFLGVFDLKKVVQ